MLYVFNLFFIGLMVGMIFVKQNSMSEQSPKLKDSVINYQSLPTMERIKAFTIQLQSASNLTVYSLYHRWRYLVSYPKMQALLSKIVRVSEKPINFHRVTMDHSKVSMLTTKITNHQLALNSAIQDTSEPSRVSSSNKRDLATPQPVGFRPDPFLTLGEKFQTKVKPLVEQKLKIAEKPKIIDKPKIEVKPKIEPNYKVEEILKIAKDNEKPSSKILRTYHLRGVVIGDVPIAYVEDQNGYHKVTIGDSFAEGNIIDITENSLTIQIDSEPVVLRMEGLK
jgi:hypothetical protein